MADTIKGKLIWQGEGKSRKRLLSWTNKQGAMTIPNRFPDSQLAAGLRDDQESEIEVDLELDNGQPRRIRRAGQPWQAPAPAAAPAGNPERPAPPDRRGNRGRGNRPSTRNDESRRENMPNERPTLSPEFHNPYNFVPAVPRPNELAGELGDRKPSGHDRFHATLLSGKLCVKMTVETPLLLMDTAKVEVEEEGSDYAKKDHKTFPVRVGAGGKPDINPTAVKGMLRSAYEAVTNSRLSVFTKHNERLAFRAEVNEGLFVVPARIEAGKIVFYTGFSDIETTDGGPKITARRFVHGKEQIDRQSQYAAWIDMYATGRFEYENGKPVFSLSRRTLPETGLPLHSRKVWAWIEQFKHRRRPFTYWKVMKLAYEESNLGPMPGKTPEAISSQPKKVEGYICNTGKTMKNKHDERFFFGKNAKHHVDLEQRHVESWNQLIKNYRQQHERDYDSPPKEESSGEKYSLEWSRHIQRTGMSEALGTEPLACEELKEEALCYARVKWNSSKGDFEVTELYPVIISRRLHKLAPAQLLPEELQPAQNLADLSPADRVFGWVNQKGQGAYRGQLRIGAIECKTPKEEAVTSLTEDAELQQKELGLPLAILGAPKPQQGRFYVAENKNGKAQEYRLTNEQAGYTDEIRYKEDGEEKVKQLDKGLRGRKVYPHHANLPRESSENAKDGHWDKPTSSEMKEAHWRQGFFKEYRRPQDTDGNEQRDKQNRSVQAWVERGTVFEFDVHFINLSAVEFGALLWLLRLNDGKGEPDHFFRLGGGKPFGFGSVTLELKGCDVRDGAAWRRYYESFSVAGEPDYRNGNSFSVEDESNKDKSDAEELVNAYQSAVREAYKDSLLTAQQDGAPKTDPDKLSDFVRISFIAAFLRAATGFETGRPIHYPRARHPNEHDRLTHPVPHVDGLAYEWFVENNRKGRQYALPDLETDKGLPLWNKQ